MTNSTSAKPPTQSQQQKTEFTNPLITPENSDLSNAQKEPSSEPRVQSTHGWFTMRTLQTLVSRTIMAEGAFFTACGIVPLGQSKVHEAVDLTYFLSADQANSVRALFDDLVQLYDHGIIRQEISNFLTSYTSLSEEVFAVPATRIAVGISLFLLGLALSAPKATANMAKNTVGLALGILGQLARFTGFSFIAGAFIANIHSVFADFPKWMSDAPVDLINSVVKHLNAQDLANGAVESVASFDQVPEDYAGTITAIGAAIMLFAAAYASRKVSSVITG